MLRKLNKNLAIANRSRVSCVHNTSTASMITSWPWIYRLTVTQGHWKRKHWVDHTRLTISQVIWRWVLSWPWNVGQRSLKVIENGTIWKLGYGFLFAFHSNLAVSVAISEIYSIKEWSDLKIWVWCRSSSLKMARFDRPCMTFCWSAIVTIALSCTVFELFDVE